MCVPFFVFGLGRLELTKRRKPQAKQQASLGWMVCCLFVWLLLAWLGLALAFGREGHVKIWQRTRPTFFLHSGRCAGHTTCPHTPHTHTQTRPLPPPPAGTILARGLASSVRGAAWRGWRGGAATVIAHFRHDVVAHELRAPTRHHHQQQQYHHQPHHQPHALPSFSPLGHCGQTSRHGSQRNNPSPSRTTTSHPPPPPHTHTHTPVPAQCLRRKSLGPLRNITMALWTPTLRAWARSM